MDWEKDFIFLQLAVGVCKINKNILLKEKKEDSVALLDRRTQPPQMIASTQLEDPLRIIALLIYINSHISGAAAGYAGARGWGPKLFNIHTQLKPQ